MFIDMSINNARCALSADPH
jgi:hypothetical protein